MLPEPLAVQVPPAVPEHVQLTLAKFIFVFVEKISVTVALITLLGPTGLETLIVYVRPPPTVYVTIPSVFLIRKSAEGANRPSISVAELFPGTGSVILDVTDAVLTRLPVEPSVMVAITVYRMLAPLGRLTVSLKLVLLEIAGVQPFAPLF